MLLADTQENFIHMNLDYSIQKGKKLPIIEKSRTRLIDIEAITHLQCDGYVTTIHLIDNESINVSKLLKLFEIELAEFGFLRANHNTIVNPFHIREILSSSGKKMVRINNSLIIVSRRRAYLFKDLKKN
ncbi:MAG: two-component system, LytTR family, response regulator [Bacteroidales bacterium]|nr:two component transcriptional regulator, LytTR family [Defluviitaleaceae bacterium]MDI3536286.1 two-component system, LytTR family, response regulator [Eubacteriaceae bacterium]MDK2910307.1 two-component system, LytTR family, response regulator [Bacteroidales bacterium]